jgi:hypothetical protein
VIFKNYKIIEDIPYDSYIVSLMILYRMIMQNLNINPGNGSVLEGFFLISSLKWKNCSKRGFIY